MLKIEEHKEPQHNLPCENFINPKRLYLPLSQHTGKPSLVCIKPQDIVEQGQVIATEDGYISSRLHSPKKAKIIGIDDWYHPVLKRAKCIIAEPIEEEERKFTPKSKIDNLDKETLLKIIKDSGIVGMGGAAFPSHVKLNPPKKIETLIVNGCECEPYLASDYRLMVENFDAIFRGIEIVCKIIEPKNVVFSVEENKQEAIKKLHLAVSLKKYNLPNLSLAILKTAYPQGGEKQLIYSLLKREVPSGRLPLDVGCLVHNVGTFFAIYEAVYLDKPLIERVVTFAGDALVSPKNIRLKIGTILRELFDKKILEFKTAPLKIICGGPMMGIALDSLDYPILKGTGGFLFLSKDVLLGTERPCIRCGACVRECPVSLMPTLIDLTSRRELWKESALYGATDCIECGVCNYVCPTNRMLLQSIKRAKLEIPR
ncbi:MAG: electron transport complex subunit RsxC [Candidatus Omnitrophica bacterium]|jgi:electron transport complex protein RnfC|nr:electron transport complex subunit RsxC [Candidatus Omnitrophota bacterium]